MKAKIILLVSIFAILALGITSYTGFFSLKNSMEQVDVARVLDGDTVELSDGGRVRLLGINAPEENENFYKEAASYLENLIGNKKISLDEFGKDKYGRTLGYLYLGEVFVNLEIVKSGFAHVYFLSPDEKYYLEFKKAEKSAKEQKLGIWKVTSNVCISVVDFNYDAKGNDNNNLNDEFVVLKNNCDNSVDMSGWEIKDEGTNIYKFKSFKALADGEFTLYSGSGTDSDERLYWNNQRAIWNNDKDVLFLRDTKGNLVLNYPYPN